MIMIKDINMLDHISARRKRWVTRIQNIFCMKRFYVPRINCSLSLDILFRDRFNFDTE